VTFTGETAKKLAAARDITAVLVFAVLVVWGGRALLDAPFLQKERLSGREAAEDISGFFDRVEKERPAAPAPGQYAALKAAALLQAEAKLDEFKRITVRDLAYILYRSAAAFGDADTRLLWRLPRKWKDPELKFPPFGAAYSRGRFTIDCASDPSLAGSELIELNGVPFEEFISPVLERVSGETPQLRAGLFCRDQFFWWNFSGLLSGAPSLTVKLKRPDGRLYSRKMGTVTAGEFRRFSDRPGKLKKNIYGHTKIGWLSVSGLPYSRAERKVWDRFFRDLRGQGTEDLVLDLRQAGSGDPRTADYILTYLPAALPEKREAAFSGRLKVLIGPGSGSAAAYFAARLRELKAGELLGEETGGTPDHLGAPEEFELPNSGIKFSVSTRLYSGHGAGPVEPDLPVTGELLRPYKGDVTPFVLDLIGRQRGRKRLAEK